MSCFPFMRWGLYALDPSKAGTELLPFVGPSYSVAKFEVLRLRILQIYDTSYRRIPTYTVMVTSSMEILPNSSIVKEVA